MSKSNGLRPPNGPSAANLQDRMSTVSGDHRFSGIGAGFMNGDLSDSDSDDDDSTTDHTVFRRQPPGVSSTQNNTSRSLTPGNRPGAAPAAAAAAPAVNKNLAALADLATSPPAAPKPIHAAQIPRALNLASTNNNNNNIISPSPQSGLLSPREKQSYPDEKKGGWNSAGVLASPAPPYIPLDRAGPNQSPHHIAFPTPTPQTPLTPSSPYPLMSPGGPIVPAFSKPAKSPRDSTTFKAQSEKIIRGIGEERILPKRGDRGDDFWRRFSIVAKEDKKANQKPSSWLNKTMHGSAILNRSFLILSIVLLLGLVGGIFTGWYLSHKKPGNTRPEYVGNAGNYGATSAAPTTTALPGATSVLHVDPQGTVARRSIPTAAPPAMKRTRSKRHAGAAGALHH